MPINFSLAQIVILRSGISVMGLAVRERSAVSKQSVSLGGRGKQTKKAKIVQIRPKVLNIRLFWKCSCEISDSLSTQTATDMIGKIKFHEKMAIFCPISFGTSYCPYFQFFSFFFSTMQKVAHSTYANY